MVSKLILLFPNFLISLNFEVFFNLHLLLGVFIILRSNLFPNGRKGKLLKMKHKHRYEHMYDTASDMPIFEKLGHGYDRDTSIN